MQGHLAAKGSHAHIPSCFFPFLLVLLILIAPGEGKIRTGLWSYIEQLAIILKRFADMDTNLNVTTLTSSGLKCFIQQLSIFSFDLFNVLLFDLFTFSCLFSETDGNQNINKSCVQYHIILSYFSKIVYRSYLQLFDSLFCLYRLKCKRRY